MRSVFRIVDHLYNMLMIHVFMKLRRAVFDIWYHKLHILYIIYFNDELIKKNKQVFISQVIKYYCAGLKLQLLNEDQFKSP